MFVLMERILCPSRLRCAAFCCRAVLSLATLIACQRNEPEREAPTTPSEQVLQLVTSYALSVTEPSGLAYSKFSHTLYMISDNRSEIFKIDTTGRVLTAIPVAAQDIEGIAVASRDDTLYLVEETASQITAVLANGAKLWSQTVLVRTDPKHALEGITLDARGHLFVINEKAPAMLLEFSGRAELWRKALNYTTDVSDICYDESSDCFWIVSDESQKVLKLSRTGALLGEWSTPVVQGEGLALINNRLYIVSDAEAKLYIFTKPQ